MGVPTPADITHAEISDHAAHIERLERELAERRAAKAALERLLKRFTDTGSAKAAIGDAPRGSFPAPKVGQPTEAVERRVAAMVRVIQAKGPMGPGALRAAVEADLANGPVSRSQITDVLRRREDAFRKLKRGRYGLAKEVSP